jgi:dipeptidase E
MQKIFLTSDLGCSTKIDGIRYSTKMNNINGVVDQIKSVLTGNNKMIFFVSNPTEYEKNDNYARLTFESFKKSGFAFNNEVIIDDRFNGDIANEVKSADLIFLSGGETEIQMNFFEKIGLRDILKDYNGVIIGQSAGAINLATEVLCPPEYEEEIGKNYKWLGLSKTSISVEPHFVLNITDELDIRLRNESLKISSERPLYAICDGSHIYIDDISAKLFGEAYLIENNNITKINDNGRVLDITTMQMSLDKKI